MKRLETINNLLDGIQHMREMRKEQERITDELEYVLLIQSVWEQHGETESGLKYKPSLETPYSSRAFFVLTCTNGERQRYQVKMRENFGEIVDLWGNPEVPDRLLYLFLVRNKIVAKDRVEAQRRIRLKREKDDKERGLYFPTKLMSFDEANLKED